MTTYHYIMEVGLIHDCNFDRFCLKINIIYTCTCIIVVHHYCLVPYRGVIFYFVHRYEAAV